MATSHRRRKPVTALPLQGHQPGGVSGRSNVTTTLDGVKELDAHAVNTEA